MTPRRAYTLGILTTLTPLVIAAAWLLSDYLPQTRRWKEHP